VGRSYEFAIAVQESFDYEWPYEVFIALGVDDGEADDEEGSSAGRWDAVRRMAV